jgi:hypothetical protein
MTADSAPTQRNKLLEEGATSYPKAMYALSQFRAMVQVACIDAMKKRLQDLSRALGLPLESGQVKAWGWPNLDKTDGTWANLGAMIKNPGGAKGYLYNCIWWEDDPHLWVLVSIGFAETAVTERAWATVRDHGTWKYDEQWDPPQIELLRSINAADLARLGPVLDEMNHEWIQGWQKVGGVKQFLRKR